MSIQSASLNCFEFQDGVFKMFYSLRYLSKHRWCEWFRTVVDTRIQL